MPIDFHNATNRATYTQHVAGTELRTLITDVLDPVGARVVDLGCGGGIYTRVWRELGAGQVAAVDFSTEILDGAREHLGDDDPAVSFHVGDAADTGLAAKEYDVVFARALVHHLADYNGFAREAARLLRPGGTVIVQDRIVADIELPASPEHLRGYFFTAFPRLLDIERDRRPRTEDITAALRTAGFDAVDTSRLWETHRTYTGHDEIAADLRARTGRSLLHDLDDHELEQLIHDVLTQVPDHACTERDPWTLWTGQRSHY